MMWILHICHSYYPPFLDCARQYNALFKNTPYKVLTVYLTGEEDKDVVKDTQSDEVVFLGYKSKEVRGLKIGAIAKIKAIVKDKNFLFCIAHRVKPTYVALLATDLPVVSVHHNYNDYSRWSRRLIVNFYKNRLLMLGVSNSVRDELRRDLKGWSLERIQTLYNRIDLESAKAILLSKDDARVCLKISKDAFVIGNVGRLHRDKDQATLIKGFAQALPQLPRESILVIMGKGSLEEDLKAFANQLGVAHAVIFTGSVPDARRFFKAFDVFALTSDHEPFGMVLLEAMVANLPIICSNSGGGAEIVEGIGDLFSLADAKSLETLLIKNAEIQRNTDKIQNKLITQFTDQAVRAKFWNIEYIRKIIER